MGMVKPEDCPSPVYHDTHRYCPYCSFTNEPTWKTQYEVVDKGMVLAINANPNVTKCVRLAVLAEDGYVDYVFDLTSDQALSVAEAVLHSARLRMIR